MSPEQVHATPLQIAERLLAYAMVFSAAILSVYFIQSSTGTLLN